MDESNQFDKVIRYIRDEMSSEEIIEFENELQKDEELQNMLEVQTLLFQVKVKEDFSANKEFFRQIQKDEKEEQTDKQNPVKKKKNNSKRFGLLALLGSALLIGFWLWNKDTDKALQAPKSKSYEFENQIHKTLKTSIKTNADIENLQLQLTNPSGEVSELILTPKDNTTFTSNWKINSNEEYSLKVFYFPPDTIYSFENTFELPVAVKNSLDIKKPKLILNTTSLVWETDNSFNEPISPTDSIQVIIYSTLETFSQYALGDKSLELFLPQGENYSSNDIAIIKNKNSELLWVKIKESHFDISQTNLEIKPLKVTSNEAIKSFKLNME